MVPDVLSSGNHDQIRRWRRRKAIEKTKRNRPELLKLESLDPEERAIVEDLQQNQREI